MTHQKFKSVKKDRLFYDRFEYCMGFSLNEISCLRSVIDHAQIDSLIERRKQWREIAQQRWVNGRQVPGISDQIPWRRPITEQTVTDLHALADVLLASDVEFKLVVSSNQGYVYTNTMTLIDQLDSMDQLHGKTYTKSSICRPKNTIQLKNPQFEFRSYFKITKLTAVQKDYLMDFLHNQKSHIRTSPALQRWIDQSFTRTQDYFFVDYNNDSWLSMLSLVVPGIIRKTMQIIPTK